MTTVAAVNLWGSQIGAVSIEDGAHIAAFQPGSTESVGGFRPTLEKE